MTTQPEALRLADWCDSHNTIQHDKAATELRRLHAMNQELLTAVRNILKRSRPNGSDMTLQRISAIATAAIAKAEGQP